MKLLANKKAVGQTTKTPHSDLSGDVQAKRPWLPAGRTALILTILVASGCTSLTSTDGALGPNGPVMDRRDFAHVPDPKEPSKGNEDEVQAAQAAPAELPAITPEPVIIASPIESPAVTSVPNKEIHVEIPADPDKMGELLNSLETASYPEDPATIEGPIAQDNLPGDLWQRIRDGFAMPELATSLVADKEKFYLARPDYMARMMTRGGRYLFHIVEEIERRGMPTEIALLPFVESAMNPVALSSAKAAGLWQFIPSTGRAYDLKQNWWVDNRRDVVQSTRAALDYLESLHLMHDGDWFLALASYNWGEGSVNRAIKRNKRRGKPTDYLSLRMPRETRHYVPKLIALKNILMNADKLGVALPELPDQPYFVVIEKTRPIDLELAAEFSGLSVKEFVALNPAHNRPIISATRNNQIKIPAENLESFLTAMEAHEQAGKAFVTWRPYTIKKRETIATVAKRAGISSKALLKANGLSSKRRLIAGTRILVPHGKDTKAEIIEAFAAPTIVEIVNRPARYHRVKRRDSLSKIAKRWGVSRKTLRRWNGMKSDTVRRGQRLLVRQPARQTIQTSAGGRTRILSAATTETLIRHNAKRYKVKRGDTLGAIARKHKVSVDSLRRWNRIKNNRILIGQRLNVAPARVVKTRRASPKLASATVHKVRRGENLGRIANRYKVSVSSLRKWNGIRGNKIVVGQRIKVAKTNKPAKAGAKPTKVTRAAAIRNHKVRRGDTLSGIAKRYSVSVSDLRRWNRLKSSKVMLGQRLRVSPAIAKKRKSVRKLAANSAIKMAGSKQTIGHRVKSGDTLSAIASRYGVSVRDLRRWNSIKGSKIRRGQRLEIKVGSRNLTRNKPSGKVT